MKRIDEVSGGQVRGESLELPCQIGLVWLDFNVRSEALSCQLVPTLEVTPSQLQLCMQFSPLQREYLQAISITEF